MKAVEVPVNEDYCYGPCNEHIMIQKVSLKVGIDCKNKLKILSWRHPCKQAVVYITDHLERINYKILL